MVGIPSPDRGQLFSTYLLLFYICDATMQFAIQSASKPYYFTIHSHLPIKFGIFPYFYQFSTPLWGVLCVCVRARTLLFHMCGHRLHLSFSFLICYLCETKERLKQTPHYRINANKIRFRRSSLLRFPLPSISFFSLSMRMNWNTMRTAVTQLSLS